MSEARLLPDWLASYLEFTQEQEAPESFHLWTALATLSAALRRRIFIDMTYGTVYSNIYVIMVADSAKVRKSTAANIGRRMLLETLPDLNIMQDSMTSQGLTKSLNRKTQVVKDNKITEELRSDVAIFADEIANLFSYDRVRASQMTIFLTRTYECPNEYDHTTVRDSKVRLHKLYPVLVGCTDPKNVQTIPESAADGLTGRLIWLIESERRNNNPGWQRDEKKALYIQALREMLMHDLRIVAQLQGEVKADDDAMDFYTSWYEALSNKSSGNSYSDAFFHRCHTTVLRIAMLLSVAVSDTLRVTHKQMMSAIALIEQQLPAAQRMMMWAGNNQYVQNRAKYIDFLQKSKGLSTRRILLHHMGMTADEFDRLTITLVQDGSIEIPPLKVKNETVIKLNGFVLPRVR